MPLSKNMLTGLRARRRDLYVQLRLIDRFVAAVQGSSSFRTLIGNSVTMNESIETVEAQITDINRRIAHIRRPIPNEAAAAVDLG